MQPEWVTCEAASRRAVSRFDRSAAHLHNIISAHMERERALLRREGNTSAAACNTGASKLSGRPHFVGTAGSQTSQRCTTCGGSVLAADQTPGVLGPCGVCGLRHSRDVGASRDGEDALVATTDATTAATKAAIRRLVVTERLLQQTAETAPSFGAAPLCSGVAGEHSRQENLTTATTATPPAYPLPPAFARAATGADNIAAYVAAAEQHMRLRSSIRDARHRCETAAAHGTRTELLGCLSSSSSDSDPVASDTTAVFGTQAPTRSHCGGSTTHAALLNRIRALEGEIVETKATTAAVLAVATESRTRSPQRRPGPRVPCQEQQSNSSHPIEQRLPLSPSRSAFQQPERRGRDVAHSAPGEFEDATGHAKDNARKHGEGHRRVSSIPPRTSRRESLVAEVGALGSLLLAREEATTARVARLAAERAALEEKVALLENAALRAPSDSSGSMVAAAAAAAAAAATAAFLGVGAPQNTEHCRAANKSSVPSSGIVGPASFCASRGGNACENNVCQHQPSVPDGEPSADAGRGVLHLPDPLAATRKRYDEDSRDESAVGAPPMREPLLSGASRGEGRDGEGKGAERSVETAMSSATSALATAVVAAVREEADGMRAHTTHEVERMFAAAVLASSATPPRDRTAHSAAEPEWSAPRAPAGQQPQPQQQELGDPRTNHQSQGDNSTLTVSASVLQEASMARLLREEASLLSAALQARDEELRRVKAERDAVMARLCTTPPPPPAALPVHTPASAVTVLVGGSASSNEDRAEGSAVRQHAVGRVPIPRDDKGHQVGPTTKPVGVGCSLEVAVASTATTMPPSSSPTATSATPLPPPPREVVDVNNMGPKPTTPEIQEALGVLVGLARRFDERDEQHTRLLARHEQALHALTTAQLATKAALEQQTFQQQHLATAHASRAAAATAHSHSQQQNLVGGSCPGSSVESSHEVQPFDSGAAPFTPRATARTEPSAPPPPLGTLVAAMDDSDAAGAPGGAAGNGRTFAAQAAPIASPPLHHSFTDVPRPQPPVPQLPPAVDLAPPAVRRPSPQQLRGHGAPFSAAHGGSTAKPTVASATNRHNRPLPPRQEVQLRVAATRHGPKEVPQRSSSATAPRSRENGVRNPFAAASVALEGGPTFVSYSQRHDLRQARHFQAAHQAERRLAAHVVRQSAYSALAAPPTSVGDGVERPTVSSFAHTTLRFQARYLAGHELGPGNDDGMTGEDQHWAPAQSVADGGGGGGGATGATPSRSPSTAPIGAHGNVIGASAPHHPHHHRRASAAEQFLQVHQFQEQETIQQLREYVPSR